jgi:uncharacterized repeat protein (TIGR01451 family)
LVQVYVDSELPTNEPNFYEPAWFNGNIPASAHYVTTFTASESSGWTHVGYPFVSQGGEKYLIFKMTGLNTQTATYLDDVEIRESTIETDLSVTKTADVTQLAPNQQFQYTITVTNNGPLDADFVTLFEDMPNALIFVQWNGDAGVTYDHISGQINIGALAVGESKQLFITMRVPCSWGPQVVNTVGITGMFPVDSNLTNNNTQLIIPVYGESTCSGTSGLPGLEVHKYLNGIESEAPAEAGGDPVIDVDPGEDLTFTITIQNVGAMPLSNIYFTDYWNWVNLNSFVEFTGWSSDLPMDFAGMFGVGNYMFHIPSLDVGQTITLTMTGQVFQNVPCLASWGGANEVGSFYAAGNTAQYFDIMPQLSGNQQYINSPTLHFSGEIPCPVSVPMFTLPFARTEKRVDVTPAPVVEEILKRLWLYVSVLFAEIETLANGEVVPKPIFPAKYPVPLSKNLATVVDAELASSKSCPVPVP